MGASVFLFLLTFVLYIPGVLSVVQVGLQGGATAGGLIFATATWSRSPEDSPPAFIAKVKEDTDDNVPLTSPPVPVTTVDGDDLHGSVTLTFNRAGIFHLIALAEDHKQVVAQGVQFGVEPAPQFQTTPPGNVDMATASTISETSTPQIPSPTNSPANSGALSDDKSGPSKMAIILSSVFGGLIFLLLLVLLYFAFLRRRKLRRPANFRGELMSQDAMPGHSFTDRYLIDEKGRDFYPDVPHNGGDLEKSLPARPLRPLSGTTTSTAFVLPYSYTKVHLPKSARQAIPRYPAMIRPMDTASVNSTDSAPRFGPPTDRQIEVEQMIHDLQLERLELQRLKEEDQRSIVSGFSGGEQDIQMASLTARIESLTKLQTSDWALGRTDDVPTEFFY